MQFPVTFATLFASFLALTSALPKQATGYPPEATEYPTEATEYPAEHREQCSTPIVRKEWRTLSNHEKTDYLSAVKCMMRKPPMLSEYATGITTRWEDFLWTHQVLMPTIHYVGQFLPWHRLFLYEYERVLREECGYSGGVPYWDQSKDYQNILNSPVFNGAHSFGGNGEYDPNAPLQRLPDFPPFNYTGGGCIKDGPFQGELIHLGHTNDTSYHERCIKRNIIVEPAQLWESPSRVADVLAKPNYEEFAVALEGNLEYARNLGIHNTGHLCVEGDMGDMWVSPGDPIFYIFHSNIDRIWWKWQQAEPSTRLFDVGNPIAPRIPMFAALWPDAPPGNVTLDYDLTLGPLRGDRLTFDVAEAMDNLGSTPSGFGDGVACYTYE